MIRPRLTKQEIAFIGIPTLLVLGGAAFFARQQALRAGDRRGPYRAEIARTDILAVSPFESWQGFDTKIVVSAKDRGQLASSGGANVYANRGVRQKLFLVGKVDGKLQKVPVSSFGGSGHYLEHPGPLQLQNTVRYSQEDQPEMSFTCLANTSGFDADAKIELKGDVWFERTAEAQAGVTVPKEWLAGDPPKLGNTLRFEVHSKPVALDLPLERRTTVNVDRSVPPVENVEVDLLSPVYAHTNPIGDNGSCIVHVHFKSGTFSSPYPPLRSTDARIYDAQGHTVEIKDLYGDRAYKTVSWDLSTSPATAVVRLPLERVPLERGPLKMKIWFAVEDGWPVPVEVQVRPVWVSRRASLLKLKSVRVEKGDVIVKARYTGKTPLRYESNFADGPLQRHLYFDARDDTRVGLIEPVAYKRLFTHWSQHHSMPNGKGYWFPNAVSLQSVTCDAKNDCRIIYKTNALNALKPGQSARFSAQIGIQDDGFLPIQATITKITKP